MNELCLILTLAATFTLALGCSPDLRSDERLALDGASGQALLARATDVERAIRATSEARTATLQAATVSAQGTRDAGERSSTATAQALAVREREIAANATANALGLMQMQTRQAATATAQAVHDAAAETAELRALALSGTRTAAAVQATATTYAATSTRGAEEIAAALSRDRATATAEALTRERTRAQEDLERGRMWTEFFDTILKIILGVGSIALLVMLIIQLARYLDALAARQRLVETRSGTVLIVAGRGGYAAQLVSSMTAGTLPLLERGDEFDESQTPVITNQAPELLKLTNGRGETFIPKTDPQEEQREQARKLAMRLLRDAMRHYGSMNLDPRTVNRIPSFRDLNWSSETWTRAVATLKPHVVTKQGRGGGTFCGQEFPNLVALYAACGERRISLTLAQPSG